MSPHHMDTLLQADMDRKLEARQLRTDFLTHHPEYLEAKMNDRVDCQCPVKAHWLDARWINIAFACLLGVFGAMTLAVACGAFK